MAVFAAALVALVLVGSARAEAQAVAVSREGSRPITAGPSQHLTGGARIERLFESMGPSHASGGSVTFEAGARTAWHEHPRGQILIVTAGTGRVQRWGDPIQVIRSGDVVRIPPRQKHWHGAAPDTSMTHLAISEHSDGTVVTWMEHVTDEQYAGAEAPASIRAPSASSGAPPVSDSAPPVARLEGGPSGPPSAGAEAPASIGTPASMNAPAASTQTSARPSGTLQPRIAPGLAVLTDDVLYGDVWTRPQLSARDRSLVTVAVLIATGKTAQLTGHLGRALDNGVRPSEASGLLAHLAIYCGWPSAVSALSVYDQVYTTRNVDTAALRVIGAPPAPLASDTALTEAIAREFGTSAPKFAQLTSDVVFGDLWRRPDLSVRDRHLVTIAALAAMGDADEIGRYSAGSFGSGLTMEQMTEAMTHLAFYAGWGKATRAIAALTRAAGR